MMKLKENASLLIANMKNIFYIFLLILLGSCTSNTIFEKPENLIPKDTMSLLVQEMSIATSAKYINNKNFEKRINYMPLVYERFGIDSVRFQTSNMYYMSKIDVYQEILTNAKESLEKQKSFYDAIKKRTDSLRADSIKKIKDFEKIKFSKDSLKEKLPVKN
ncbi:DUF4296 domain-containing protein [Polaribacter sp. Hel_I_88]|uniref:DUF4296 domain-containing protein n=1 Tax=Polaribacter sp. Hel_I_88 TaxID=1250006 RepID=UPI001E3B22EA|nr:DUF4296 domain-containing protein [Polaribacter sp. Hel_I_88]